MNKFTQITCLLVLRAPIRVVAAGLLLLPISGGGVMSARAADYQSEGVEVLTRGPVHEAFAGTISFETTKGILVSRRPPATIEELPPEQRPEGGNVAWIPGYWAWDDEGNDFLWVSGIWRNLPPGRQWIPGYWEEAEEGQQWTSGYWADAELEEIEYLSEPPRSLEAGPNIDRPSRNHTWIPGYWAWRETRYLWSPGTWQTAQPNWVWVPPCYVRDRRGTIFVDGYYDHSVSRRGMIFAPVRFSGERYSQPDYRYRPSMIISLAGLVENLFLRPQQHHYYFGDYYAPQYRGAGYYPSHNYYSGGHGYDPIYAQERWTHRDDDRWESRHEENYTYYRDHEAARPPRTLTAWSRYLEGPARDGRREERFALPFEEYSTRKESPFKLRAVSESEQNDFVRSEREIRKFSDHRKTLESRTADARDPDRASSRSEKGREESGDGKHSRVKIPKSPVVSRHAEGRAGDDSPPERPKGDKSKGNSGAKSERDQKSAAEPGTAPGRERRDPEMKPKEESKDRPSAEPSSPGKSKAKEEQDKPKGESKGDPKGETKGKAKEDPGQPPSRGGPKSEPKAEPKRESKSEPKAEPKRDPKSEPKRESKQDPKSEPKREPKSEPKSEPKRESKKESAPKKDSGSEPKPQPGKEAKSEKKNKPDAKPKGGPKSPEAAPAAPDKGPGKAKSKDEENDPEKGKGKGKGK